MKTKLVRLSFSLILVFIVSCDEPTTVVRDIVHTDGSVTRRIEMKNYENNFSQSEAQVPFDTTWIARDSLEIYDKDTIWVRRIEKLFKNADEINQTYITDSSSNRMVKRSAGFKRTFKWFNTEFRFAEKISKNFNAGYPVSDFLSSEELEWFYSPDFIRDERQGSQDSLKYRAINDSVNKKTDLWMTMSLVSEWIYTFGELSEGKTGDEMSFSYLKEREGEFVNIIRRRDGEDFDSLWTNGILLREFIGERNAEKYKTEADSAIAVVTDRLFISFNDYTQEMVMPGKLIATNGVIDSTGIISWQVQSDYFMTEDLEMWAQSRTVNTWAWIITSVFLLFVLGGFVFRASRK